MKKFSRGIISTSEKIYILYFKHVFYSIVKSWKMFTQMNASLMAPHVLSGDITMLMPMSHICDIVTYVKSLHQGQCQSGKTKYEQGNNVWTKSSNGKTATREVIRRFRNLFLHSAVWPNTWFHRTG